jgi:hypothetical protein
VKQVSLQELGGAHFCVMMVHLSMRVLIIVMVLPFLTGAATKRSDIVKFVKEHFPGKISKLDAILDRYSGKEDKLMKKLVKERLQLVVHTHYSKFKPQAIDQVDALVKANAGAENELILSLEKKEKNIAKWKKKIQGAYKGLGLNQKIVDGGIDQLLQTFYGKESKLMKQIQQETLSVPTALLNDNSNGTASEVDEEEEGNQQPPLKSGGDVIVFGQQQGELHSDKMGIYQIQVMHDRNEFIRGFNSSLVLLWFT